MSGKSILRTLGIGIVACVVPWMAGCRGASPSAATPETTLAPPPLTGVVEGTVTRGGRPRAAVVTATLERRAPDRPDSWEAWRDMPWSTHLLFDGLEPAPRATVTAGPDGRWSFRGLGPGFFRFEARDADGWCGVDGTELGSGGARVLFPREVPEPIAIGLRRNLLALRGRVRNPDGTAFVGFVRARVEFDFVPPAPTDAEGRFTIRGLRDATVRLDTLVPGVGETPGPIVNLPCEGVEFTTGQGFATVEGIVRDDATGKPVAGAVIEAQATGSSYWGVEVRYALRADDQGRLLLHVPGDGLGLGIEAPGFGVLRASISAPSGSTTTPQEFRLLRPAVLRGRVTTADGAPAAGARMFAEVETDDGSRIWHPSADGEGRYEIPDLPPGPVLLLADGGGYLSRSLLGPAPWDEDEDTVTLAPGTETVRDVVVAPSARARGRVVDAEGQGVGGLEVVLNQGGPFSFGVRSIGLPDWPLPVTSADGTFSLPHLVPGCATTLSVRRAESVCATGALPALESGEEGVVEIRIHRQRAVEFLVVEAGTGKALADVDLRVEAQLAPGDWTGLGECGTTDGAGHARLDSVPAVALHVRATGDDPYWTGKWVDVAADGAGPVRIEVGPEEMPGTLCIEGRVLLPDGRPAAEATLECWSLRGEGSKSGVGSGFRADAEGRFRVRHLDAGSYEVEARLSRPGQTLVGNAAAEAGRRDLVITTAEEVPVQVELDDEVPEPRILVRVLGPSGKPLAAGSVHAFVIDSEGGSHSWGNTLRDGRCPIGLEKGSEGSSLWFHVTHARDAGPPATAPAHQLFGPFPCTPKELEVTLSAGVSIEGRVTDAAGKGIPRAHVNLLFPGSTVPDGDNDLRSLVADAIADETGGFRFDGANQGEYEVAAEAPPAFGGSKGILVRGGARDVNIVVPRSVSVLVTVLDSEGKPVEGADVKAEQPRSWEWWSTNGVTNAAGMVRLRGLDPAFGAFLGVRPPADRADLRQKRLPDWTPADTTVRLE